MRNSLSHFVLGTQCPWCCYLTVTAQLAAASCHLYDGNAVQGQKGNFLHSQALYVLMKGKCVSLCVYLRSGFLVGKKLFTDINAIPPSLSVTHTHTLSFAHTSMLSAQCWTGGESGKKHSTEVGTVSESWGQAGLDFPVLYTEGASMDLDKGGFFWMREGQTHHQQCLISSNTPHLHQLH